MGAVSRVLRRGVFGEPLPAITASLALGVVAFVASLPYDALNHGPNAVFLRTPLDDAIPVVGPFVVPYVSLRPLLYVSAVVFLLASARIFRSAALAMAAAFAVSYVFYVVMQSYVDRPQLGGDDVFSRMIRDVYASDQPYNDFPSLHASLSTVFALHWWRLDRRAGAVVGIWATLIVLSTVFVKQHYVPDVVAGVALGALVSFLALRLFAREPAGARAAAGPAIAR